MDTLKAICDEYWRYQKLAEGALAQLDDEALFMTPALGDSPAAPTAAFDSSVAMIMNHVGGNLLSRFTDFLSSDGEKPWRKRDTEFDTPPQSRAELLARWEAGWEALWGALKQLDESMLDQTVIIRRQPWTVAAALQRSVTHISYHVGQIVLIAKVRKGEAWESLSVARGQSEVYNRNPTLDRSQRPV